MPTPAEIPCSSTDPKTDSSTTDNDDGNVDVHQLELQFFTLLDGYNRNPPERVYWRDVVNIVLKKGLATAAVFIVGMRRVTPAIVHHVALTLYYYANAGGVIQTSHAQVAADCHMDRSTVTRAITVLKRLSLLRGFRTSRRAAETLAMNIGGLTWSAARQQARERRRMARAQNRELDFDASSGGPRPQLEWWPTATTRTPEWWPTATTRTPEWWPTATTMGCTYGLYTTTTTAHAREASGNRQAEAVRRGSRNRPRGARPSRARRSDRTGGSGPHRAQSRSEEQIVLRQRPPANRSAGPSPPGAPRLRCPRWPRPPHRTASPGGSDCRCRRPPPAWPGERRHDGIPPGSGKPEHVDRARRAPGPVPR